MSDSLTDELQRLSECCSVFYQAESIPIYLIRDGELLAAWPPEQPKALVPFLFIRPLEQETLKIGYYMTPFSTYFSYFRLDQPKLSVYLGPVGTIPHSDELMKQIRRYYCISADPKADAFYRSIPPHTITEFLSIMNLLYFMCTGKHFQPASVSPVAGENSFENNISDFVHIYMENQLDLLDTSYYNNSYDIECLFAQCIENGDIEAGERLLSSIYHISAGRTAQTIAMHNKNLFIITIAIYTRAAIRGGLDTQTAFSLSDAYLQQIDRYPDEDLIEKLSVEAFREFIRRVNQLNYPADLNQDLLKCIRFVKQNVTHRITVADVADFIGYSRQYLSQRFKKDLGFDLGKFILRTKLTEAQQLLQFSEKPLSEISELLCFSSQSHFQRAFKAQFGLTPLEYRRQNRKGNESLPDSPPS